MGGDKFIVSPVFDYSWVIQLHIINKDNERAIRGNRYTNIISLVPETCTSYQIASRYMEIPNNLRNDDSYSNKQAREFHNDINILRTSTCNCELCIEKRTKDIANTLGLKAPYIVFDEYF